MNSTHGKRRRTAGVVLAAVLGALAVLALPGVASAHQGKHHRASDRHGNRHHHRHHRRHRHLSSVDGSAGTIASFDADTGRLTITLDGGDTVSGLVTDRTHIRCGGGCDKSDDSSDDQGAGVSVAGPLPRRGDGDEESPGHDGTPPGSSEDPGQGADHTAKCTTADLVVGAVVKQAEMVITGGKAYFTLVALGK